MSLLRAVCNLTNTVPLPLLENSLCARAGPTVSETATNTGQTAISTNLGAKWAQAETLHCVSPGDIGADSGPSSHLPQENGEQALDVSEEEESGGIHWTRPVNMAESMAVN